MFDIHIWGWRLVGFIGAGSLYVLLHGAGLLSHTFLFLGASACLMGIVLFSLAQDWLWAGLAALGFGLAVYLLSR